MIVNFEQPNFELNEEVWAVCGPNSIVKSTITAFQGLVLKDSKSNIIGIAREARLSNWILDGYFDDIDDNNFIPLKYLTKEEEKARGWMKVYPVIMTDEEWLLSIGNRDIREEEEIGNIYEGCELLQCCANISAIRSCLIRCKDKGSLIGWEREELQELLNDSCHEIPETHKLLDKIFSQLNVTWSYQNA